MKLNRNFYLALALILLTSCQSLNSSSEQKNTSNPTNSPPKVVTLEQNFKRVAGQTIYVPVYSEIYHHNRQEIFYLAATLSIRNTDLNNPIIITSVRYYDTNGKLVKQYLDKPIQLNALASTDFFVTRDDTSGGVGANFIVEWVAAQAISEPIIEAVMIGTDFQQGISFISPGRVIKDIAKR
ncbi:DUF3124 domain-containing protein [Nostoc sp. FACHB-110]|uniref:DUF3124 domain-containing protein n=1 Tax=Nostoc sp. FACHB-110 TaxID=2692834 RepID=UPI001687DCB6|nr:DUF3124 domain-containing protein [Nostoc sp. FACHB-110]MBD2437699.1 DUF3124 domain-containing protein [Nostoc sp. FACHB-110]